MKIAIIGCGWLGLPLANNLLKDGHTIFGSATRPEKIKKLNEIGMDVFLYDGKENFTIPDPVNNADFLIINFPPSKSKDYARQIESLLQQFPDTCKVIFTSSTGVYEDMEAVLDESAAAKTDHPVFLAEEMIRKSNKQNTILRLAGLIGKERHPVKYLSERHVLDGNVRVNLIHLEDVIQAIVTVMLKNAWGKLYNVCWPEHPKKVSYYTEVARKLQIPPPNFELSDRTGKCINGDKIRKELDFQYNFPI